MILRSLSVLTFAAAVFAQAPPRPPQVTSPEVQPDRTVTFRLHAPDATEVKLNRGDIPADFVKPMTKGENGVWEVTLGPLVPGAYRYTFIANGLAVLDPRNPTNSESNDNVWSMAIVPGSDTMDTREVPHGAVAAVTYQSKSLGRARRMHVYTPPGTNRTSKNIRSSTCCTARATRITPGVR
jgi:enterochelin esterase family protein